MRALLLLTLLAACERTSTLYCEKNPDQCTTPPDIDASVTPIGCTTNDQCVAANPATPICVDMMVCGQCAVNADCTSATMPTCDSTTHDCRACRIGSDCASEVCLATTGTCADEVDVAYIGGANAGGTACTLTAPCATFEDAQKLDKHIIRLLGDVTQTNLVTFSASDKAAVLGGGFVVHFKDNGFRIADMADITMDNFEIVPSTIPDTNSNDDCIYTDGTSPTLALTRMKIHDCGGDTVDILDGTVSITGSELAKSLYGVEVLNGASVSIVRTAIHHNAQTGVNVDATSATTPSTIEQSVIAYNGSSTATTYPGIDVWSSVAVTNTIIAHNGAPNSMVGGVRVNVQTQSIFDFVTIADNIATASKGMSCVPSGAIVRNSIMTGNTPSIACVPTYTLLDGDAPTTDKVGLPMFASTTDVMDPTFYHLTAGSAAIDSADPAATVTKDIDGDTRPLGHADMGADELHP